MVYLSSMLEKKGGKMNGARSSAEKNRLFIFSLLFSPTWREREER